MVLLGALTCLSGCGNFFVKETDDSDSDTTTGANRIYVANSTSESLSCFTVGTATLSSVSGFPFSLGYVPLDVVVTPSNSYLYVAGPDAIYGYAVASDGTLTAISGGPAVAAVSVASLTISPDGQWLFGLDSDSQMLDEYQINSSTGALSAVGTTTYAPASGTWVPRMVRVSPTGSLIFASLGTAGDVVFTLNTSTGAVALSQTLAPVSTQTSDNAIAVNSAGTYLYIARSGTDGGVAVYTVGTAGALNSISGSPFSAGTQPYSLAMDSTGTYLYAANRGDGTISGYTIGTGSVLTALSNSPFSSGTNVASLTLDQSKTYLLAGSFGGSPDLSLYTLTAGQLSLATSATSVSSTAGVVAVASTH